MYLFISKEKNIVSLVEKEPLREANKIKNISNDVTFIKGDLDNVPYQKNIYRLDLGLRNNDLYGEERKEAKKYVSEYLALCQKNKKMIYPFLRNEKIEKLRNLFQGEEHFKAHIDQDIDDGLSSKSIPWVFKDENFYGFANRAYYNFITDLEVSSDEWDEWGQIRQQFAEDLFEFNYSISDVGLYRYLCENFDVAVSMESYRKYWNKAIPQSIRQKTK